MGTHTLCPLSPSFFLPLSLSASPPLRRSCRFACAGRADGGWPPLVCRSGRLPVALSSFQFTVSSQTLERRNFTFLAKALDLYLWSQGRQSNRAAHFISISDKAIPLFFTQRAACAQCGRPAGWKRLSLLTLQPLLPKGSRQRKLFQRSRCLDFPPHLNRPLPKLTLASFQASGVFSFFLSFLTWYIST